MHVAPKPKKEKAKKSTKPQVRKDRFDVVDPKCISTREALGAKYGTIGKDHVEFALVQRLNKAYESMGVTFKYADAEKILKAVADTYNDAVKTAAQALTADGSDLSSVSIWNPVSNGKATKMGTRTQRDIAIQLDITKRKEELKAEGKTDEEIAADEEIQAMMKAFEESAQVVDNTKKVKITFKNITVDEDLKTNKERAQEARG